MRTLFLAGAAIVSLAGSSVEAVKAADIYGPAPGYSAAPAYEQPPPRYGYAPPVYAPPPQQAYGPPPQGAYGPPPAAYDDDESYAPPRVYRGPPAYAERPRYRDAGGSMASGVADRVVAGRLPDAERDAPASRERR